MSAYLRIDGLDPEDLDEKDRQLFEDLANAVFAHLNDEAPDLFEQHEGVIPVRNPEHDLRLLETTAVYAHRDVTVDDGEHGLIFCSFEDDVNDLDTPHYASVSDWTEVEMFQHADPEELAELLPSETDREDQGDDPVRVGTLYHDSEVVFRVDLDHEVFEDGEHDA